MAQVKTIPLLPFHVPGRPLCARLLHVQTVASFHDLLVHFVAASILTALTDTHIRGFVKILRDTTESKEAQEYQERRQEQIAVLRERDRLAHEFHDALRQGLSGIERQLDEAQGVLGAGLNAHESERQ